MMGGVLMLSLCLVTQKGGTGKSGLAINLAVLADADGLKTCILDLDPQGTVSDWYESRAAENPWCRLQRGHRQPG